MRESTCSIERSIIEARKGSFSAIGQILEHYRGYLLALANNELPLDLAPKFAPSDLVQETFYQASRDFPNFAGLTDAELRAWLRKILIHNLQDVKRRFFKTEMRKCSRESPLIGDLAGEQVPADLIGPDPTPSDVAMTQEMQLQLNAALQLLSDEQRRVIELRSFQGRPFEEVGRAIGRSAGAARKIWVRAIDQLSNEVASNDTDSAVSGGG
jgi:RNA polymerase sigma-70 factor (ECF subfamily)